MVCAVPVGELISVIPTPIVISSLYLFNVSFVRLFLTSSIATSPIWLAIAKDLAAGGSETGLSLTTWG